MGDVVWCTGRDRSVDGFVSSSGKVGLEGVCVCVLWSRGALLVCEEVLVKGIVIRPAGFTWIYWTLRPVGVECSHICCGSKRVNNKEE
jgi:hypothetical protein